MSQSIKAGKMSHVCTQCGHQDLYHLRDRETWLLSENTQPRLVLVPSYTVTRKSCIKRTQSTCSKLSHRDLNAENYLTRL